MKKYELVKETAREWAGRTLYRIRACRDFETAQGTQIKKGDLGGWVEGEENLSHKGDAWIFENACVRGDAEVRDNAIVDDNAEISDNAIVRGHARVAGHAIVSDHAKVSNNALVSGNARVGGGSSVSGYATICENAWIFDYAKVSGNSRVSGKSAVFGGAWVCGNAQICDNATIKHCNDVLTVGPIGSRGAYTTFFRSAGAKIYVACGCFSGDIDSFLEQVKKTHGGNAHAKMYRAAAELARMQIALSAEEELK